MKRNKLMAAACLLLALTMITTSTFSGVLAKYIVSDGTTDSARVAKFGVLVSATGDLFGDTYGAGDIKQTWTTNTQETVSAGAQSTLVIAPGTKNEKGMTFSVKGTPEVSTTLHVDALEDSNKDYANTDLVLKEGTYSIMKKIPYANISLTGDTVVNYYTLTSDTFTAATAENLDTWNLPGSTKPTYLYEKLDLVDGTTVEMSGDYYPINWTVKGTSGTAIALADETVATVLDAVSEELIGGDADHTPNQAWNASANVTWAWDFGTAWADGDADTLLANWENTSLADFQDTVLGMMITRAIDGNDPTAAGVEYLVASGANLVKYATIDAVSGSANQMTVAYTGASAPATWDAADVACLTATFGARLTVEQVN